jgi:hypothetical protein
MVVRRRFVTLEGEILDESSWTVSPIHRCFYCNNPLLHVYDTHCPASLDGTHDLVTLVDK